MAQLVGTHTHAVGGPGVVAAVAGETLSVRMQARDRFGNATAWKRWQTLSVAASGPQDVVFKERLEDNGADEDANGVRQLSTAVGDMAASGRGVFSAVLHRAGAYVVWCTVGGQAVVGWPRVIQVVPNTAAADASEWRAEAETMALTSEIASNAPFDRTAGSRRGTRGGAPSARRPGPAPRRILRARLAKYEEAAAVVMEAAEATGIAQAARQGGGDGQGGSDPEVGERRPATTSATSDNGEAGEARTFDARATRQLGIASSPRRRKRLDGGDAESSAGEDPGAMTPRPDADRLSRGRTRMNKDFDDEKKKGDRRGGNGETFLEG